MGEATNFQRGTNWRAKNTNSIKLSTKGNVNPVTTVQGEAPSAEMQAEMGARRLAAKRALETERSDARRRAERAARAREADAKHAEKDHTPPGWGKKRVGPLTPKQARAAAAAERGRRARKRDLGG